MSMQDHEDERKREALLKFYRQRVIEAKCNSAKLTKAVDELIEYMREQLNQERRRFQARQIKGG